MKLSITAILAFILFASCSKKTESKDSHDSIVDDNKINVIKFEKSDAVIFPKNYWKKPEFHDYDFVQNTQFFTPSEKTIRNIEALLPTTSDIILKMWGKEWMDGYKIQSEYMSLYDKQFFGYVNAKKDSIVSIKIFNFESDPYHLRETFNTKLDEATCGWYNTNTLTIEYSLKYKKLAEHFK